MTAILGISAFYHDSAAALVVDGDIVAAAQEERFTRRKHDHAFPVHAIRYCLDEAGIAPEALDYVGFYDKPFLKLERLLETYLSYAPRGFRSFLRFVPLWAKQKLHLPRENRTRAAKATGARSSFTEHHESHAASAFFSVTVRRGSHSDAGRGRRVGDDHLWHRPRQPHRADPRDPLPHSLGLLYSAFTHFTASRSTPASTS